MIDDGGQQVTRRGPGGDGGSYGDGQQFRFIGGDTATAEARIIAVDLQQQPGDARRGHQLGKILPRPGRSPRGTNDSACSAAADRGRAPQRRRRNGRSFNRRYAARRPAG